MCADSCMSMLVSCACRVRVGYVCIYIVFLTVYDRRIRFYSIMQLACVFKYILEFGTLIETTHRAALTMFSSFVLSFRASFAFADPHSSVSPRCKLFRFFWPFFHSWRDALFVVFEFSVSIEIVRESFLDRNERERRGPLPEGRGSNSTTGDCTWKSVEFDSTLPGIFNYLERTNGGWEKHRKQLVQIVESPATSERCFKTS